MIPSLRQPQNETVPQTADRVPPSIRRFGAGLVEQARLRAKFAAAVAVASGAVATAAPAMAEDAAAPLLAEDSLFLVIDPANDPSGVKITPITDIAQYVDPVAECGPDCKIELRCPGGRMDGIIFQERMDNGGISAIVDRSRGRAGLAFCPGDQRPFTFVVPEYLVLPPLTAIPPVVATPLPPLVPLVPKAPSAPAAPEAAAPLLPDAVSAAPPAESEPPAPVSEDTAARVAPISPELPRAFAVEAGVEIPVNSTHNLLRDPGVFVQGVGRPLKALAGARGVLRAAWNPIAMQPAGDDARFHPRNPIQQLNGNMVRATGGLTYPYEVAKSGGFSLDAEGGVDAGLAVLSVPRRRDVGVDQDGYLADIPGSDAVTAVVEGHGGLTAHFGERLRVALGLRYGQSPFAVQTRAGASQRAHFNFVNVNAGVGVQF